MFILSIVLSTAARSFMYADVIIVGAGISGLNCALSLKENGINVLVFEALPRVGGRIHTIQLPEGYMAELGGHSLLDGGEPVCIRKLVDQFHLETEAHSFDKHDVRFMDQDGVFHTLEDALKAINFSLDGLAERVEAITKQSHHMDDVLQALFPKHSVAYQYLHQIFSGWCGADPKDLSVKNAELIGFILQGGFSSTHKADDGKVHLLSIKGGNALLPLRLAETLGDAVHMNMPVQSVTKQGDDIRVTFVNGESATCHKIVFSNSPASFSQMDIDEKIIPYERLQYIKSLAMGTSAKIIYPYIAKEQSEKALMMDGLSTMRTADGVVPMVYVTGENGRSLKDNLGDLHQKSVNLLTHRFEGFSSDVIPEECSLGNQLQKVESPISKTWSQDPYFGGSYSYIAKGQEDFQDIMDLDGIFVKKLFKPVNERVYFCGEAASIIEIGTIEGAAESGERISKLIMRQNP